VLPAGLDTPAVVIDLDVVEANVRAMAALMAGRGVSLRPHAKTHKSARLARMQLDAGAGGITVATLGEAEVMADAGIDDLFVAFPVWAAGEKGERLGALQRRVRLRVGVDSVAGARALAAAAPDLEVLVELDSGLRRTGVPDAATALEVAEAARSVGLRVIGLFTHGGHGYASPDAAQAAGDDEVRVLVDAADVLRSAGFPLDVLSAGSTPTAGASARPPVTEERPGTYVFNDGIQVALGVAAPASVGLVVAATVVSTAAGVVVIDAGAKVLAREPSPVVDGLAAIPALGGAVVERAYDHHGVLRPLDGPLPAVGTVVAVVPNHVCPVVNLADELVAVRRGVIVERWPVDARSRNS
jgi:D-serine deaminase-like pyridoxal phosphate-dependent protein